MSTASGLAPHPRPLRNPKYATVIAIFHQHNTALICREFDDFQKSAVIFHFSNANEEMTFVVKDK